VFVLLCLQEDEKRDKARQDKYFEKELEAIKVAA
jgi:hypothetical protein